MSKAPLFQPQRVDWKLSRKSNWPTRLALFVEEKRAQKFKWGQNDCCMFVCDWLAILTGLDPASIIGLRDTYHTGVGAMRKLKELGGVESIAATWCAAQNWTECPSQRASRGDVVLFLTRGGAALGVCLGQLSVFAGPDGISFVKTSECSKSWHIP